MWGEAQECLSAFSVRTPCDSDADGYGPPFEKSNIVPKGSRLGHKTICGLVSASLVNEPCHLEQGTFPWAAAAFVPWEVPVLPVSRGWFLDSVCENVLKTHVLWRCKMLVLCEKILFQLIPKLRKKIGSI